MNDPAAIIVALLGAGGIGAFAKDIIEGIWKLIRGVSAGETKRRIDVVQQRDEAIARADAEAGNRRSLQEYVSKMRRKMLAEGITPDPEPELENTMPIAQLRRLRDQVKE